MSSSSSSSPSPAPPPVELLWPPFSSPSSSSSSSAAPPRFHQLGKVGEGAFGDVYVGVDTLAGTLVALKDIRLSNVGKDGLPKTALRELRALRQLSGHAHVVRLLDAFPRGGTFSLVLEYMPSDLEVVLSQRRALLPEAHLKSYLWMLLQGLHYLHARRILHRDLKPSNLLLSAQGVLKIGDLGHARVHVEPALESYSHQVGTKWYRAPELLFGARHYGPAVDLWAVGVIFGELACLRPLFPGHNDLDQLYRILQVLGTPTPASWPGATDLPDYHKVAFPGMPAQDLAQVFPRVPPAGVPLLRELMRLDPNARMTAEAALADPFFFLNPLPCDPRELDVPLRPLPKSLRGRLGGVGEKGRRRANED